MFFLMREHIFPAWDDPCNISGGCVCLKIPKSIVETFWHAVCANLLGETLVKEAYRDTDCIVNGVSISPKNFFCIIKIWLSNDKLSKFGSECFEFSEFDRQTLYKPNDQESQKFAADHT
jgi:hypothetical protein